MLSFPRKRESMDPRLPSFAQGYGLAKHGDDIIISSSSLKISEPLFRFVFAPLRYYAL